MPQVFHAQLYRKSHPELGAVAQPICGGHMIFAGAGSLIGRAVGLGFEAPVSADDLDRIEAFYFSRGAASQMDVCPLTDPTLMESLKQRGYLLAELNNVLFRRLDPEESFPAPPMAALIRSGGLPEAPVLTAIVRQSFFPDGGAPEGFDEMLAQHYQMPGAISFAADLAGTVVACGAGLIIPEHKIVALYGAGTLPASPPRAANCASAPPPAGGRRGRVRIRGHRDPGWDYLAT